MIKHDTQLLKEFVQIAGKSNVTKDVPLSGFTTFRVGGPADIFISPTSVKSLTSVLNFCLKEGIAYFIIGRGSNLIVSDKGIRGVVISTLKHRYAAYYVKHNQIFAGCGLEIWKLSRSTAQRGLSGLEFACGIPGTVGGAVFMNAGAYDGEISKVLVSSRVLALDNSDPYNPFFEPVVLSNSEHNFSYRHSVLQEQSCIHLSSTFQLEKKSKRLIKADIDRYMKARESKQPLELPSAGSVFRRPEGHYTGRLIESCGLKGFRIGGAAVSQKHCGFIVNLGNATAADILAVIEHVKNTVLRNCGITLQTEVRFVGEP